MIAEIVFDKDRFPAGTDADSINKLCNWIVDEFEKNNELWMRMIVESKPMRFLILQVYLAFGNCKNDFITIDKLPEKQKREIWETAKEFGGNVLNEKGLIDFSRCLYMLETLLK